MPISARYPDALPAGAPFEILSAEQAERALQAAVDILNIIKDRLPHDPENP